MRNCVLVGVMASVLGAACGERAPSGLPTIDPVPSLTIRVPDSIGGPAVELGRAVRLADGGVAVADLLGRRLLRFGADGALLRMYGGPGSAPGLFRAPSLIEAVAGDSLLVWDPVLRRVTWLSLASGETRDLTFQSSLVYGTAPVVGQMNDGTLLIRHELQERPVRPTVSLETPLSDGLLPGANDAPSLPTPAAPTEVRAEVIRLDKQGREVGKLASNVLVRQLTGEGFRFFSPALQMSTDGERVVLGYNGEWQLRVFSATGDSVATLTRDWTPRAITDREREAVRQAVRRSTPAGSTAPDPQFLATRPAFGRILMSRDGTVWATEFSAPGVYVDSATVFNAPGTLLGTLAMPLRFSPTEAGRDYLLGLGAGDDGVTEIRLYQVRW